MTPSNPYRILPFFFSCGCHQHASSEACSRRTRGGDEDKGQGIAKQRGQQSLGSWCAPAANLQARAARSAAERQAVHNTTRPKRQVSNTVAEMVGALGRLHGQLETCFFCFCFFLFFGFSNTLGSSTPTGFQNIVCTYTYIYYFFATAKQQKKTTQKRKKITLLGAFSS